MTTEQVAKDRDQQPEPDDEHEHRESIDQEVTERKTFVDEQHRDPPSV